MTAPATSTLTTGREVGSKTGLGDSIVAVKDLSAGPKDNRDRVKKLGRGQQRPFSMVMKFGATDKLRRTPDGYDPAQVLVRVAGGTGTRLAEERSIVKSAEPDNWWIRDQSPPGARNLPTTNDQVYAIRAISDRENPAWKRPNRSTNLIDQQGIQLQAGIENVAWTRLVPTRGNKAEEKYDALGEPTWATLADELVRRIRYEKSGTVSISTSPIVGLNPDPNGFPVVPVPQPQTNYAAAPPAILPPAVVFTGGNITAPAVSGPPVGTIAKPKPKKDVDAPAVAYPSSVINASASGGYVCGWASKDPGFAAGDVAIIKVVPISPGGPQLPIAFLVPGNSSDAEPVAEASDKEGRWLGNLSHLVCPVRSPWGAERIEGVTEPGDAVNWAALGIRPDAYYTSPRRDVFGPLSISPMFWDRPQGPIGHHLLGDLYWSNEGSTMRGSRFAGDPNANTKEVERPPTPWRLRLHARIADFPAWHLPPNLFLGNFCDAGDDPLPMGTRQGVIGMGVAETVDWATRVKAPTFFASPHGSYERLAPGLRLSAHVCAATGQVDEVAAHVVAEGREHVERRAARSLPRSARVDPSELELRRQTSELLADRLQSFMLGLAQALSMTETDFDKAKTLAARAADLLRDLAELKNGLDVAGAVASFNRFAAAAAEAAKPPAASADRLRPVPFLPPASSREPFPAIPASPSGIRFADAMNQIVGILNAHSRKLNKERVRRLLGLTDGAVAETTDFVTAAPDGRVFHADENGDLFWDENLQFDRTNKRLGIKTASPATTLDVNGSIAFRAVTFAVFMANQNDLAIADAAVCRVGGDAVRNVTGIAGGVDGRRVAFANVRGFNLRFTNQDVASTDINRIITGTGANFILKADATVELWYDTVVNRWRII